MFTTAPTIEQIRAEIDAALLAYDETLVSRDDALNSRLETLEGDVSALGESVGGLSPDGVVYEVRATDSQVETAKGAVRLLATEGLFLLVALALCCGLLGWRAFADRWF